MHREPVPANARQNLQVRRRNSLRMQLIAATVVFSVVTMGMAAFAAYQFNALRLVTEQVNAAGRLRMLSQHAALLVHLAARGDQAARQEVDATLQEFDASVAALRRSAALVQGTADSTALAHVNDKWTELKTLIGNLASDTGPMSYAKELELSNLANATLRATEDNVAVYFPRAEETRRYVNAFVPVSIVFSALFVLAGLQFVRRRILRPLQALEQLTEKLTAGELSARSAVQYDDEVGRLTRHVNVAAEALQENIRLQVTTLEALRDSETRNRTLWEISSEAIVIINTSGAITFANPAVFELFGHAPQSLVGESIAVLQPEHLRESHRAGMARYLSSGVRTLQWSHIETQALHQLGHLVDVELSFSEMTISREQLLVGTFRDITERKRQQEALIKSANFDSLTGLPNRVLLHDRIEQTISSARRHNKSFGILFLDLDNFKIINDTLGHECGDLLLCEAARRLLTCVRDGDTVARVGGDEFVLLLSELLSTDDVDLVAQRALSAMSLSFNLGGSEGFVGVSIGASVFPQDGDTRVDLMQHADIAMYRAKDIGRNNYQRYAEPMQARFKWRMSMEVQLRHAIDAGELVLHYQPQIEVASGRIVGAEALIRWESPLLGRVSPAQFIPLAEETGLIVPIGNWVIRRACSDAATWLRTPHGKDCSVAINLSPRQFHRQDLLATIVESIADCQMAAHCFEFEVTEGLVMQDPENAAQMLSRIRELGCTVAMDDFGTGYSSLASLRSFPIDVLKIDKSLIHDMAIVQAVIQMARSFGFRTLAEGVEDEATYGVLRTLGCDIVQGYYFARPMVLDAFHQYLEASPIQIAARISQT